MFVAWFEANQNFVEGRDLTYSEFPSEFVYHAKQTTQRRCTSFECIRTINGTTYDTFQEACYALGLLDDDRDYIDAIVEANEIASGNQLRRLFVTLLLTNTMSKPYVVWDYTWKMLSDGILYERRKCLNMPGKIYILCLLICSYMLILVIFGLFRINSF